MKFHDVYMGEIYKINANGPIVEQPEGFTVDLYKHQLLTIARMKQYEKMNFTTQFPDIGEVTLNTDYAFLETKDKSLTVLGFLANTKNETLSNNYHTMNNMVMIKPKPYPDIRVINTTVIIYSYYTREHWENEIKKTNLSYKFLSSKKDLLFNCVVDVVFCSCRDVKKIRSLGYVVLKRVILDNAEIIKCGPTLPQAMFKWYVTNNYVNVSLRTWFNSNTNVANLKFLVLKCDRVLYRKFNNITCTDIRCKTETMNILTRSQIAHYTDMLNNSDTYVDGIEGLGGTFLPIEQLQRELPCSLSLERRNLILESTRSSCPICIDDITQPVVMGCCHAVLCVSCFVRNRAINMGNCPMCRANSYDFMCISPTPRPNKISKLDGIKMTMEKFGSEARYLILSSNDASNDKICSEIPRVVVLKGKYTSIVSNLTKLSEGKINCVIMNDRETFMKGIPLTGVTVVIVLSNEYLRKVNAIVSRINSSNVVVVNLYSSGEKTYMDRM